MISSDGGVTNASGTLPKSADFELLKVVFTRIVNEGDDTLDQIADTVKKRYRYSESWTRRMLKNLVEKGVLEVERQGRVYRYRAK